MCTLRNIVTCGMLLAVLDIFYSLATSCFFCYQLVMDKFYICPMDLSPDICNNKIYLYNHIFGLRVYIGIGEGIVGLFFDLFYVLALVKQLPKMVWLYILKALGVIGINGFFLAFWLIRRGHYTHLNPDQNEDEALFHIFAKIMTFMQLGFLVIVCLINVLFIRKLDEEKSASSRSFHRRLDLSPSASVPSSSSDPADYTNDALDSRPNTPPTGHHPTKPHKGLATTMVPRGDTFKSGTGV